MSSSLELTSATTTYHRASVDGVGVFYREAGPKDAPTIVLLHGFPSSSREFDTLIPLLATRYHLIASDFPAFGHSDAPPPSSYAYTFDNLARTINGLLEQLKIDKYSFYLHDYGGPVGFRITLAHPERVQALIIQNANVYKEGLGAKWRSIAQYWADPKVHPEVFDTFRVARGDRTASHARHLASRALQPGHLDGRVWPPVETGPTRDPGRSALRLPNKRRIRIRRGKRGCASTSRRPWLCGGGTIPRSSRLVQRPSGATYRTPKSIYSTPAILPWTRRMTTSPVLFLRSWRNIPCNRTSSHSGIGSRP